MPDLTDLPKTDWFHRALKWADHNRYTFGLLGGVAVLSGCSLFPQFDGKAVDPVSGDIVNRDELDASLVRTENELQDEFDAYGRMIARGLEGQRSVATRSDRLNEAFRNSYEQIEEESAALSDALGQIGTLAGTVNPPAGSIITGILGLAGVGFGVGKAADAKRKDREIKIRDNKIANLTNPTRTA
jgi:hypothetical protein